MRLDFVSDVACPWCAIGLASLERAMAALGDDGARIELHFQPFELNPDMGPEGVDADAYLKAKYRLGDDELAANRARLAQRGAEVGFTFGKRSHVWNTFHAHRLLRWIAGCAYPSAPKPRCSACWKKSTGCEGQSPLESRPFGSAAEISLTFLWDAQTGRLH